ncbi:MAG: adenosine kinase [Desulfobacteraceae bacterium]|nr:adenosine kinase [Desulfobacteraceae bacterium]MBC2758100.1 adenosine kinase [Desulfobacteraceae bacterium]
MGELKIPADRKTVVGVGSALMDMLAKEPDEFLDRLGVEKGGMNLVDQNYIDQLIAQTSFSPSIVSGGSACNTAFGVAKLGGSGRFVGKMGNDELGELFKQDLKNNSVDPVLFNSKTPTGRVLSVITPDAQRSMFTYLGASAEMQPSEISLDCFNGAAIVHVEGYLLFNRDLMMAVLKSARDNGSLISLDLASFNVVEASMDILDDIIMEYVDILIANEDEAKAYCGQTNEAKALKALSENVDVAALKLGPRGSLVAHQDQVLAIDPMGSGEVADTTGAGDLWASGFLFGMVNGYSFAKSGQLASACGYEVCQVIGAKIPDDGWARIRKFL